MMSRLIFTTSSYKYLMSTILNYQHKHASPIPTGGSDPRRLIEGGLEVKKFPDGETYHKMESVAGKHVIIIGGTVSDSETLELYDMGCHSVKMGARTLTLVIPYFGYSTMERAVQSGEIVKAKTRARLLSSIPSTSRTRVLFMDLHSEGTPHYLEGAIQPVHLYGKKVIMRMCRKISCEEGQDYKLNHDFVLASTDAGRAKWVESLANEMGVDCAVITKRRISGSETALVGINADVKGKKVVIYDDMIRTGGSLIGAGQAYKDAGASKVYAVATHGVLPNDSLFKLKDSGVFEKVYVTNTHPNAHALFQIKDSAPLPAHTEDSLFYRVFDVSSILYKYISRH